MCSHPTELSCAASQIHIHPTTCCRLPHSFPDKIFVGKLCHRIVPAIKQRQRIASQNAPPSSNSRFHPPVTPNSPSLFGRLDRPLCSFLSFNAPFVLCRGGQPSVFYCYPLSNLVLLMLDGCLAHFWTGANMKRGSNCFSSRDYSFLRASTSRQR